MWNRKYPIPLVLTTVRRAPTFHRHCQRRDDSVATSVTSAGTTRGRTREEFSERLLNGSVKKSYEPVVDIDWDAPGPCTSSSCHRRWSPSTAPRSGRR